LLIGKSYNLLMKLSREFSVAIGIVAGFAFLMGIGIATHAVTLDAPIWVGFFLAIGSSVALVLSRARP
jgi:hypothetical protein